MHGVQNVLKGRGLYSGCIDGLFGSATSGGVQFYQAVVGQSQDGIVGNNTWKSLQSELVYVGSSTGSNPNTDFYRVKGDTKTRFGSDLVWSSKTEPCSASSGTYKNMKL